MPPAAQASTSKLKVKSSKSQDKPTKKPAADIATDIDSIFSKPVKSKAKTDVVSNKGKEKAQDGSKSREIAAEGSGSGSGPSKKKKKKAKRVEGDEIPTTEKKSENTRVVEVVDTSIPKVKEVVEPVKTSKKRGKKEAEEDEIFADSRGTGPRRKTEEGFLIYKEAELDIDPEAGGTDLCPFDCECCF